jgi:hypothetical protein
MAQRHQRVLPLLDGPFTAAQAQTAGLTKADLRTLIEDRVLRRLWRSCYLGEHLEATPAVWAQAARLILPPGVVVADHSAALLQGVDIGRRGAALQVLSPTAARPRQRHGLAVRETNQLPAADIRMVHGVAVTSPARTAADLSRFQTPREGLVALDALTHAGLTTCDEVAELLARFRGERWTRQAADLLELCEPATESPQESRTRYEWIVGGAPRPVVQHVVLDPRSGSFVARLDLALPEQKLGGEYDGLQPHTAPDAFARDRIRQNELTALGWRLIRWTSGDIWTPAPRIAQDVLRLLQAAA